MASSAGQGALLPVDETPDLAEGVVAINARCRIEMRGGCRIVSVSSVPLWHYAKGDRAAEAYAMVNLVDQGFASQIDVATAFGCDARTVRRHQRRLESGGLAALGRGAGCPRHPGNS